MAFDFHVRKTLSLIAAPILTLALMLMAGFVGEAGAGLPEYMQLNAQVGMTLEIEGEWDPKGGVFIADDLEKLPMERLPKLRGEILEVSEKDSIITIYGIPLKVYERTEFIEDGGGKANFSSLKKGTRIEVSCKFDEDGSWKARKIKANDIKKSDKIKGTLTRVAIDGKAPDTIEISGLLILLVDQTDIIAPAGSMEDVEKELFPDIRLTDMTTPSKGVPLGHGLLLNADYRQSVVNENQYDLSDYYNLDSNELEPAVRLELTAYFHEKVQAFVQARARKKYFVASDTSDESRKKLDAHFSQLYLLFRNIGTPGLSFQVGRQDFEDDREWLYDEYLDAARVFYYGVDPVVLETAYIHGVSPLNEAFETWTDVMTQVHIYPDYHNHISSYFIMRKDTDIRNREPKWMGIRYNGKFKNNILPWFEYSHMSGRDKGRTLSANAVDIGGVIKVSRLPLAPSAALGFAYGTGDKIGGDGEDNRFRQTGYEDNVDYFGGVTQIHYYSEVIDPELSNIEIITAGIGARPTSRSSIDLIYHTFKQNRPKDELTGGDLVDPPARPNGISDDLGWEIDAVLGLDRLWDHFSASWSLGFFNPGKAFDPFLKNAVLNRINLKLEL